MAGQPKNQDISFSVHNKWQSVVFSFFVNQPNTASTIPYLQYCIISWASVGKTKLEPIHKLQKKALRICTNSHYQAHSCLLFIHLRTFNTYDLYKIQSAILKVLGKSVGG